ncbi:beta strand repeat-containing protein, partial [Yersinia massiliensis]
VASGAVANNTATNAVSATVKDGNGNIVPNVVVTFAVTGGATFNGGTEVSKEAITNSDGVATAALVSLVAGDHAVTATVGTNTTAAKTANFIADETTAEIGSTDFTVASGAAANNTATNAVSATVKDGNGNLVPNVSVTFAVSGGATFDGGTELTKEAITNNAGLATALLVSRVAGDHAVTATVGTHTTAAKTSTFVADETTAIIASTDFTVASGAVANNVATNAVSATVKDADGNLVPNVTVTFAVTGGATFDAGTEVSKEAITNSDGVATAALVSLVAGDHAVTATVGTNTTTAKTSNFIADETTAIIGSTDFTVASGAVANNIATNAVSATVKDGNGNLVPNVSVTFVVSGGATFEGGTDLTKEAITNGAGVATALLISRVAGDHDVTVTVGTNTTAAKTSTFIADETTAIIGSTDFTVASGAIANNTATNAVSATVKDAEGNLVPNVNVTFVVSGGATFDGASEISKSAVTNSTGVATATLVSRVAGDHGVTAKVGTNTTAAKTSTFIAGEISGDKSTFAIDKNIISADGSASLIMTFTARDEHNNLVRGADVKFKVEGISSGITLGPVSEAQGVYTATLTSTQKGLGNIAVYIGDVALDDMATLPFGVYRSSLEIKVN